MRRRLLFILLLAVILFLLGGILFTWGTPRLVRFEPGEGERSAPATAGLRLTFSRPMRTEEVRQRLSIQPQTAGSLAWDGNTLVFTPAAPWPSGQTIFVSLLEGARAAGWLSLPLRETRAWSFSVRTPRLLYLFPSDGEAQLYALDFQTGETLPLSSPPGEVVDFSPSEDGLALYYTVSSGAQGSRVLALQLSDGETHTLVECPDALCRHAQTSAQANTLAYERTPLSGPAISQVWLLPLAGPLTPGGEPVLAGEAGHQTREPRWSVQGVLAFYDFDASAFIFLDPRAGTRKQLASASGIPGVWAPDGGSYLTSEVFADNISDPSLLPDLSAIPSTHLIRFTPADGSLQDLTQSDDIEDTSPAISPDGRLVAFSRRYLDRARWTTGRQMWLAQTDGSAARPLSSDPTFTHYGFAWRPDGEQLAFVRFDENNPTAPPEIWLIQPDGGGATLLLSGGYSPQWIP